MSEVVKSVERPARLQRRGRDNDDARALQGRRRDDAERGRGAFDLTGLFDTLAREDFDRASALARTLKGESPRSVASLAVARSVLAKPKAGAQVVAN